MRSVRPVLLQQQQLLLLLLKLQTTTYNLQLQQQLLLLLLLLLPPPLLALGDAPKNISRPDPGITRLGVDRSVELQGRAGRGKPRELDGRVFRQTHVGGRPVARWVA